MRGANWLKAGLLCAALALFSALPAAAARPVASVSDDTIASGVYVEGVDLSGMSVDEANAALQAKVAEMAATPVTVTMGDNAVSTTLGDLGYTCTNLDIVDSLTTIGKSGNIVDRYKIQKDLENSTVNYPLEFQADRKKIRAFVKGCAVYNTEPVEGQLLMGSDGYPYVEGGTDGMTLKVKKSVKRVRRAIRKWTGGEINVKLAVDVTSPNVTAETLSLVKDILGSATTDYSASSAARAVNVQNGCSLINGTMVWPGDEFSVTRAVTPFSAENGYEPAPTYEENRTVDSYGGGICQVSTTLYNAALKAEMDITARSNHTMMVGYVEPAKDAAIAEGTMDMCFVNNTDAPIYIQGYCSGGKITFVIFGHETRPQNRTLEFTSKILATNQPEGFSLYPDATQRVGYVLQTQSPHTGYQAELWKEIYIDGVLSEEYRVNSSFYQAVGTIYSVGVVSDNPSVTQAMYAAISANNLEQVQQIIKTGKAGQAGQAQQNATAGDMDDNMGQDGTVIIVN